LAIKNPNTKKVASNKSNVITKINQVQFSSYFCGFFDGLRPYAEYRGIVLAGLDYLYSCWAGGKHGADVAIGATQAGPVSWATAVDCAKPVGLMHFRHLVVILLDVNTGAVHHGKQSN